MASSFCASAPIASATMRIMRGQPRLEPREHRLELRQLTMHAHRLQPDAADAALLVGRLLLHDVLLDAVEFVAETLGHAADGVGELVDHRVEKRHRGRKALAASMARRLTSTECTGCWRAVISMRSVMTKRSRTRSSLSSVSP